MSPAESFERVPSALVVTPEKTLLALAEKPRPKAADDPGKQGLADEAALAADDAAAHPGLAGKADEAFDLAHRDAAAGLIAGHAGELHIDLLAKRDRRAPRR
jgi:hypothetical protein